MQSYVHLILIMAICIPGYIVLKLKLGPGVYSTYNACTALMRFQPNGKWDLVITMDGLWCNKTHTPNSIPNNTIQWTELYNWSYMYYHERVQQEIYIAYSTTDKSLWPIDIIWDIDVGKHWLMQWLDVEWHQAITWSNVDQSSVRSCGIHLRAMSEKMLMISIFDMSIEIADSMLQLHLPGVKELRRNKKEIMKT